MNFFLQLQKHLRKRKRKIILKKYKEEAKASVQKNKKNFFTGMLFRFQKEQKNHSFIILYVVFFVCLAVLLVVGFFVFTIDEVHFEIQNHVLLDAKEVQNTLSSFKDRSMLFTHSSVIDTKLSKSFPAIWKTDCKKIFPSHVRCIIQEYKPAALLTKGGDRQMNFVINQAGVAIQKNTESAFPTILHVTMSNDDFDAEIGQSVMSPETLEYIYTAKQLYEKRLNIKILSLWWLERERELHIYTSNNFVLYLHFEVDIREQLENLFQVFSSYDLRDIEYIDLRVKGKVFVK